MDSIKLVGEDFRNGRQLPEFVPGDTTVVNCHIKEGNKERVQKFRGTIIRISGHSDQRRFTVRRIPDGVGVKRISPYNNPFVEGIHVERYGKVRHTRLYYLCNLHGKTARIRERRMPSTSVK